MAFSDPKKNLERLGLEEGMRVADLGSGAGHYTLAAAEAVGDSGRVYAIDIQQDLLKQVKNISTDEHRNNIEVIWGDIEKEKGTKLPDESIDVVILSNILFQAENKEAVATEALRILKQKGRLLFIDWAESFGGIGPQPENIISEEHALSLFENAGFIIDRDIDAGEHHYGFVFRKSEV